MPVTSMTGFARWQGGHAGARLTWEMRSVNGRGLDLKLRLPAGFDELEGELKRRGAAVLSRGNVQASLQVAQDAAALELAINEPLLAQLVAVADGLVRDGHASLPTADGLLALRGVIEPRDPAGPSAPDEVLRRAALDGFDAALARLSTARAEEGGALASVLSRRIDEIEALVDRAQADPARRPEAIAARLARQVGALMEAGAPDPARLAQEAALLATRADIAEEIDRLHAHLAAARGLLVAEGAVGRQLDFLAQEFHRESNTICSKSNAASLTAIGLELKVAVDQFREQVQNIE